MPVSGLVISLCDGPEPRAEALSAKTGRSLSELVADYFASLGDKLHQMPMESQPTHASAIPDEQLAQRQYRLASRYPGEFVVLVGGEVVYHSADRQSAFAAYDQAFADFPSGRPVIVDPRRRLRRRPMFRGRSLKDDGCGHARLILKPSSQQDPARSATWDSLG